MPFNLAPPPKSSEPNLKSGFNAPRAALWFCGGLLLLGLIILGFTSGPSEVEKIPVVSSPTRTLEIPPPRNFPSQDTFSLNGRRWATSYAADSLLQFRTSLYLQRYKPEGSVVVICDLRSGIIKALAERDSTGLRSFPGLALRSHFPAASLAKIVTVAAAMESKGMVPDDSLPLLGRSHTLYRFQLRIPDRGSYPKISLRDAFARSANPAFGILGLNLGPEPLRKMAGNLGFNPPEAAGESLPRMGVPDSGYGLAEVACGFVTSTTISPLHALRIARGLGDDGRLISPRFSPELRDLDGGRIHPLPEERPQPFASSASLNHLQSMMAATVSSGTARKGFHRNFRREELETLVLGGKTGSLDGTEPRGRYEWYIGYAHLKEYPDQGIAVAVMLISQNYVAIHAGELAALLIRDWSRAAKKARAGSIPLAAK